MADLPNILAGPIVRRVEPRLATVWLALCKAADVRVLLFECGGVPAGGTPLVTGKPCKTVRSGERLWVAAATVRLEGAAVLRPGTIYSYNVQIDFEGGASIDLQSEGLLKDETDGDRPANGVDASAPTHLALGYEDDLLPSFATLSGDTGKLRFAHASCRKPHGPSYDATACLDDEIEGGRLDAEERPAALFLTGDQIYADDVAACLLPALNKLGHKLLNPQDVGAGKDEPVPLPGGVAAATMENFPALRRQKLISEVAKFTSSDAACHLMSFAEFAAMYLFAWSPRAWLPVSPADEVFVGFRPSDPGVAPDGVANPLVREHLTDWETYMICDDHEVTDDWNPNGRWVARVTASTWAGGCSPTA